MTLRAVVTGVGHYLPDRIVPNSEFEKTLDTNDEWIRARSGIERRHFAAEGETTASMAAAASPRRTRHGRDLTAGRGCDHRRHLNRGSDLSIGGNHGAGGAWDDARVCF